MDISPIGPALGRPHIEVLRLREDRASIQRQVEDLFRLEDEAAAELLLIRHAEPACNELANEDPLLSCTGLQQAERLAERLGPLWFDAIYAAIRAEVLRQPPPKLTQQETEDAMRALVTSLGPIDGARLLHALKAPPDDGAWAALTLYRRALVMPQPHRRVLIRFIAKPS